jgi:long-chain acyl-CoA synthetase
MTDLYPGAVAQRTPDHPAIIMAESGATLTYAELDEAANRYSKVFAGAGLKAGDGLAFCIENRLEFLVLVWGAHYAGLRYTAISTRLGAEEIAYIVNDCGARAFVTTPQKSDVIEQINATTPEVELRVSIGGDVAGHDALEALAASVDPTPLPDRVEGSDMLYSSGTTGRPKGVKLPVEEAPLGSGEAVESLLSMLFGASAESVYLSPAPNYHSAPMRFTRAMQRLGGTVVMMEHFDAERYLQSIERFKATFSQVVPTMFVRMLKLPPEVRERYDTSSLSAVVHAAAPCPVDVKHHMIDWWGPVIHEYYAGTEGNGFVYCNSESWLAHPGTVGSALVGTIHIVGDDDEELPVGETGTVYFDGASEFEYHNDADKTKGSYLHNGWSTLGDIGHVDEDGFLYLTDRKAFMIISGGVNIYPQEAENALTMHPKVYDVAVFGVPNEDFGEEVKAVVQPADMADAGPELERELIAFCRENLADVKCPRTVDFRSELPRHPTGKLYKRLLRDEFWE